MNMAGVFEIGTSAVGVGAELQSKGGIGGSFFTGLLATIVATPCSAPFLAPALAFALSLPLSSALLFFTVIALGLALPFLLLSIFPSLVSRLPRPGAWMESFKQGMSFLLFGTVAYMIWIYDGLADSEQFLDALLGLVLAAAACWVYGRWFLPHKKPRTRLIAILMTLLLFIGGFMLAVNSPPAPLWVEWSPKLEKYHRDLKDPVYVDFTARWCATCQDNKSVYKIPAVKKLISDKNVVLMRADWTLPNEDIQKALESFGRAAVPLNLLYLPGNDKPIILQGENDELLSEQNVSAALNQIPSK
ncbi:MAG: thioredoxin family protein [Verrucomicrobiaceae bacterium]|nr:thioredoxin family protein [Verrucomicrobiaceae bacterium]